MTIKDWPEIGRMLAIGVVTSPAIIISWYLCDMAVKDHLAWLENLAKSLQQMILDLADSNDG